MGLALFVGLGLVGCGGNGAVDNPMVGPFDENGNYVEDWADNPPKNRRRRVAVTREEELEPEPKPQPAIRRVLTPVPPTATVRRVSAPRPVTRTTPSRAVSKSKPKVTAKPRVVSKPKARPKPTPKPKPKPKPKAPSYRTHRVVKGDTLYSLGRRYGASVSAIQKANGLSGNTIRIGQALKIPK